MTWEPLPQGYPQLMLLRREPEQLSGSMSLEVSIRPRTHPGEVLSWCNNTEPVAINTLYFIRNA